MVNPSVLINRSGKDYNPALRNPLTFADSIPGRLSAMAARLTWILSTQVYVDVVDLSHWNYSEGREPDYEIIKMNGFDVVIHKSTQGDWFMDDKFDVGWRSCLANDIIPLVYHFFEDWIGGAKQAQYCLTNIKDYLKAVDGKTLIFDDIEIMGQGVTQSQRQNRAKAFNETIVEEGFLTGNYSSKYLWEKLMGTVALPWVNLYFQWVANWTPATSPYKPIGWDRDDFWQYAIWGKHSWAKMVGTDGNVDVNRFYGTLQGLKDILGITPPIPPDCCEKLEAEILEIRAAMAAMVAGFELHDKFINDLREQDVNLSEQIMLLDGDFKKMQTQVAYLTENQAAVQTQLDLIFAKMGDIKQIL